MPTPSMSMSDYTFPTRMFEKEDHDRDRQWKIEDLKRGFKDIGLQVTEKEAEKIFKAIDLNPQKRTSDPEFGFVKIDDLVNKTRVKRPSFDYQTFPMVDFFEASIAGAEEKADPDPFQEGGPRGQGAHQDVRPWSKTVTKSR